MHTMIDETTTSSSPIPGNVPAEGEPCKQQDDPSLTQCETESNLSTESETPSCVVVNDDSSRRKSVTFQNVEIQEYDMVSLFLAGG